jgi:uncharacterized protein (DUF433 family)
VQERIQQVICVVATQESLPTLAACWPLLDYWEGGQTLDDFLNDFPTVSREAAIAALEEAKALVVARLE